ncbi:hypothetical protein ACFQ6N_38810 [Kitasatospora sp. NPDC056446]|uniref:hypothetical protein n=1 Tax=Kitasatospora sp. NPDC056446 TaxID=3345819 RepID=UPI0036CC4329
MTAEPRSHASPVRPTDAALTAVLEAFEDVIGEPLPHGTDTVPEDVESWTSLSHVHLVTEIESRLGVVMPERYLVPGHSLAGLVSAAREAGP